MAHISDLPRLRTFAQRGATVILLAAAAVALLLPGSVGTVTGVRPSPKLAAPDDLPALSKEDAAPFFQSRNRLEIRVSQATTLREFLDRNRLNKPFQRKQIVEQLGSDNPEAQIAAGTVFRLRLTPVAEDVPGVAATETAPDTR